MNIKVTVILPVYNAEQWLKHSVESVLASSLREFELLIIDDRGTDKSVYIADSFARKDSRVRIVKMPRHGGIVAALNRGLSEARSDIAARMDADDVCMPARLEKQYDFLSANGQIDLVSCLAEPFGHKANGEVNSPYIKWVNSSVTHEDILRDLHIESPLPHPSVMFRTKTVTSLGGYRSYDGPEDYDLWLRMALWGCRFAKLPEYLLQWRIHENNLSRNDRRYRKSAFLKRKFEFIADRICQHDLAAGKSIRICGTSGTGRRLLAHLVSRDIKVDSFVDVSYKKIGRLIRGIPVLPPEAVDKDKGVFFYICAINSRDAWKELRDFFGKRGMVETVDFLIT